MAIAALTRRSMMGPAMTVFEQMTRNAGALQDPSVYASSIQALCKALESSGELAKLLMVLHFMMEYAIKVGSLNTHVINYLGKVKFCLSKSK